MTTNLTVSDFRRILLAMADEIIQAESRLNALDAALGDGDHGITMRLGFEAVKHCLALLPEGSTFDRCLLESAQAFLAVTGGAIGVILAKMLMGGAGALRGVGELGTPELNSMLAGMESGIAKAGKAKPGDKTILDGVHAAHMATEAAAMARQTANMVCRIGRASRLGERTLGHPDPGAVSFSIMMRTFERATVVR
jgi:phosphoenolpyruvate---glycerone phosphotransferase subunit DhaL